MYPLAAMIATGLVRRAICWGLLFIASFNALAAGQQSSQSPGMNISAAQAEADARNIAADQPRQRGALKISTRISGWVEPEKRVSLAEPGVATTDGSNIAGLRFSFNDWNNRDDWGAQSGWGAVATAMLCMIVLILMAYGLRDLFFALSRLFGRQRHACIGIDTAPWPMITIVIPVHDQEQLIAGCIASLLHTDYPLDRLKIVPVNDRSQDATGLVVDRLAERFPALIYPFHRTSGKAGKPAALKDAMIHVEGDIIVVFDAAYIAGRGLLKQLVTPFFDPEVGAVMGRVGAINAGANLLTRAPDLDRSGDYQVDYQAHMAMKLVSRWGATVGSMRRSAVDAAGGWRDDILAVNADVTYRLLLNGWKTACLSRSECHETAPEDWSTRIRQIRQLAKGHNQMLVRHAYQFTRTSFLPLRERFDGMLLLLVFILPPLLIAGWLLAILLYFSSAGPMLTILIPILALITYSSTGTVPAIVATIFQAVIAVLRDSNRMRIRLLPFNFPRFFISRLSLAKKVSRLVVALMFKRAMRADKALRYGKPEGDLP